MLAAGTGNLDTIIALLSAGANVHAKDRMTGANALTYAAIDGSPSAVATLLEAGARLTPMNTPDGKETRGISDFSVLELIEEGSGEDEEDDEKYMQIGWLLADRPPSDQASAYVKQLRKEVRVFMAPRMRK